MEDTRNTAPGDQAPPGSEGSGEVPCRDCKGTGRSPSGDRCATCEGTGRVIEGIGGG